MRIRWITALLGCAALCCATTLPAQDAGADIFNGKCAHCHGADGLANTPAGKAHHVPQLTAPEIVKMSDADLIAVIKNGKGKMPSYGNRLTETQIEEAVQHIRQLQQAPKQK
jgi:mono/diheme cytochrome c family protein